MKVENINITATIGKVEKFLKEEKDVSPAVKSMFELLLVIVTLLVNRLNLNSRNSSKPPSKDPNRKRILKTKGERKPGGQKGHNGTTLKKVDNPDKIVPLTIDRRTIPRGEYREAGYESRQVIDIDIKRLVIEYRAEILENESGKQWTAVFPEKVTRPVQYGTALKADAVEMSQNQLIPYNRIEENFRDKIGISVSAGSIFNFNKEAYNSLERFEELVKIKLLESAVLHVDETGINSNGEQFWLHSISNNFWTYFYPHKKRGSEAMDEMGVLPKYKGTLCHDHWKPYYKYECIHALCNAHHLRELEGAWEEDGQSWAKQMQELLKAMNISVNNAGGILPPDEIRKYRKEYRIILRQGEKEFPSPDEIKSGCKGRPKRTKSHNLLKRLIDYEDDALRFMEDKNVPFTNNQSESDIRMTKVQQKISGCFRSLDGAKIFCRIRGYISTCRKNGIGSVQALNLLFRGELPEFIK